MGNCSSSRSKHSFKGLFLERVLYNPQTSAVNKKASSHWNYFSLCFFKRGCIVCALMNEMLATTQVRSNLWLI